MNARDALAALLAFSICMVSPAATSAERSVEVAFGKGNVILPVPDGFALPSATPQTAVNAIQRSLPAGVRLMAVIVDANFLARAAAGEHAHLSRYFIVHTDAATEKAGISRAAFDKIKADLRDHAAQIINQGAGEAQMGAARASSDVARDSGDPVASIALGSEDVIGAFDERPDSISIASVSTVTVSTKDGHRDFKQVVALGYVRIHGRGLSASVYSDVQSPSDIEWAKHAIQDWLTNLAELNRH